MELDVDARTTAAAFAGALVVLVLVVTVVGVGRTLDALARADTRYVALIIGVAVLWLASWGLALRTVLDTLSSPVSVPSSTLIYAAALFANNVTPFGQAGGEPVSALLISRAADTEYETGLASIASVDALHFLPSLSLAVVGLGYLAATTVFGRRLQYAALAVGVLVVAISAGSYVGWRHRYELEAAVARVVTPVVRFLWRLLPNREPPGRETIEARIESFFGAVDRVASDRRALGLTLGFSALGWLWLAVSLWLSLMAVGASQPFATLLVVVPVGSIASITPLPGGLGGVEAVLVALLAAVGVPVGVATAAVLIHRGATYLFPTIVGGGVAAALSRG